MTPPADHPDHPDHPAPATATAPTSPAARRPLRKRAVRCLRRGHLYAGLFLLPWAVLYGVTGFLFNHPNAFPDQPARPFGPADTAGTPLAAYPPAADTAAQLVTALNAGGTKYTLVNSEKAAFGREFAFATVTTPTHVHSVLVEAATGTGVVRTRDVVPPPTAAPFAADKGVAIPDPPHARVTAALPAVLDRVGWRPTAGRSRSRRCRTWCSTWPTPPAGCGG